MSPARLRVALFLLITPWLISGKVGAPVNPTPWWPASGAVILGGGGLQNETADKFIDRLIALAGGPDALIVVIPTASDGLPSQLPISGVQPARIETLRKHLESRGARRIAFLHTRDRQVANSESFVSILKLAKGIFFPGGASRVLDETYHGTLVEREARALLKRGGVIAGDSAGAITIGCFWLSWLSPTSDLTKVTEGLCLLPGTTVTPHVQGFGKEWADEISRYLTSHPATISINIEENTALVLKGSAAEVIGKGGVTIFGFSQKNARQTLRLASGEQYDLAR